MQMMMYCIGGEWWYDHHHEEDDNDEVCDDDADDDCDEGFPVLAVVSYHREHYLISTIWILFEYWIIRSPLIVMKVSQCWQRSNMIWSIINDHHHEEDGNVEVYDDADDDCDEGFPVLAVVWCHREHLVPLSPLGCTLCAVNIVHSVHSGQLFPIIFNMTLWCTVQCTTVHRVRTKKCFRMLEIINT